MLKFIHLAAEMGLPAHHAGGQALLWDIQIKGKPSIPGWNLSLFMDVPAHCFPFSEVLLWTMWS